MENEVTIKHDKTNDILTFQAKGEIDFLENITKTVISKFYKTMDSDQKDLVKAYDVNKGYIGKTIDIDNSKKVTPEHYTTGIKKQDGEQNRYKCRYICPNCGAKENKYLYKYSEYMYCRLCNEKMPVTWMEDYYEAETDKYNNFAFAGKFKPKI